MTTWTRDQIAAVRGFRATAVLDDLAVEQSDGMAVDVTRGMLAKRIIHDCHPHAVEVHAADIEYRVEADPLGIRITARWNPGTRAVAFVGGPADGQRYDVQGAPYDTVEVAVVPPIPAYATEYSDRVLPRPQTVMYGCVGWHEQDRHLVYGVR